MSQIAISVPPIECPKTQLPTPANLVNLFGTLITQAERAAFTEIEELKDEGKKLKKKIEVVREILSPYDPNFQRIEIPEKEYEIMIQRMINEYSTYVQAKMLEIVADLTPIEINITLLGIQIDVIKFAADREHRSSVIAQIDVDSLYDLLPPEYQLYKDKFDSKDLKAKSIQDFIEEKIKPFLTGNLLDGLKTLGLSFTLPTDPREAAQLAITNIINDTSKSIDEKIEDLKSISIGGYTLEQILGGEFDDNVEISEFTLDRLKTKLLNFAEDYWAYLTKEMLSKITDAIETLADTVGSALKGIIAFLTFDFCAFLSVVGFPKEFDLSEFSGITEVPNNNKGLGKLITTTDETEESGG